MKISRALFFAGCFSLLGVLFYSSGYMMGRGLLHASLPKPAKPSRTPSLDPKLLMSHDGMEAVSHLTEVDTSGIAKQIARFADAREKNLHRPSENVEALKQEPLIERPTLPKRRVRPFEDPPKGTFYVAQ